MNYRVRAVRVKQHDERNRIERVCGTRTTERPLPMDRTTGSFRETIGHESSRTDTLLIGIGSPIIIHHPSLVLFGYSTERGYHTGISDVAPRDPLAIEANTGPRQKRND